jgi:hypothetical protein
MYLKKGDCLMAGFSYEDLEKEFLEAMATRFCFTGKNRVAFLQRFSEQYAELTDKALADEYERELVADLSEGSLPDIVLRDRIRAICIKLEDEGCRFPEGLKKGRWQFAKKWLREEVFPGWYKDRQRLLSPPFPQTLSQLWELMKSRAKRTDNMGPVLWEGVPSLGARPKKPSAFLREVPKDSDILFKVRLEREGHLILLEREPNGTVCCLCPSEYAVEWRLPAGEVTLPQPNAPFPTFGADELGWEQWLAIASLESPPFAWLEDSKREAVELDGDRLHQLWQYADGNPDCELMYAEYQVVSKN